MVEKSTLSPQDKEKISALLQLENALEFMSSEESEEVEAEETSNGPPGRHIKPLRRERTKLRNIKVVLDATYQARMSKRQKRTAAKRSRIADQNMSDKPLPKNCESFLGRARGPTLIKTNGII